MNFVVGNLWPKHNASVKFTLFVLSFLQYILEEIVISNSPAISKLP